MALKEGFKKEKQQLEDSLGKVRQDGQKEALKWMGRLDQYVKTFSAKPKEKPVWSIDLESFESLRKQGFKPSKDISYRKQAGLAGLDFKGHDGLDVHPDLAFKSNEAFSVTTWVNLNKGDKGSFICLLYTSPSPRDA